MANPNFYALRKKRQSPNHYSAEIDEYNNRQHMRCVETRNQIQETGGGAPSAALATANIAEHVDLLPCEWHAYSLYEQRTSQARKPLFDLLYEEVEKRSIHQSWNYRDDEEDPPLERLTNILLDEWLHTAGFFKLDKLDELGNPRPVISAFAGCMDVDRKTWRVQWHKRFMDLRPILREWHRFGRYGVDAR